MRHLLVGDVFDSLAVTARGRTAAVLGEQSMTFGELVAASSRYAHTLAAHGVSPRSRVVHWSGPAMETMPLFVALARMGAVFAPISPQLGADEAAALTAIVDPALIVVDEARTGDGAEVARRLGVPLLAVADLVAQHGDDVPLPRPDIGEDDPHVIFFTSGSTGRPKGVVLSHRVSVLRSHPGALLEPRGAGVIPYPLFHMAAWTQAMQQWHARDTAVFTSADPGEICHAVDRHRATRLNAIPAVWRRVLEHLATAEHTPDLSSLRFADSGTSATPPDLLDAITVALPQAWMRIFYGATETGAATMLEHPDIRRKPGSAGRAAPLAEVRVAPTGELQVRGPQVFEQYYGDDEATQQAFDDGWYRTGDLAEIDDDGFVTIVGRLGEVIRTGGESVVPGEVEAVLREHERIADLAVVGVPDETWGEVVCVAIVPTSGSAPPSLDELAAMCAGRLARFKQPRRLLVLEAIPRTQATGQIQRRQIVALAVERGDTS